MQHFSLFQLRTGASALGLCAGLLASTAQADQVFLDDLIVDGSACIGFDCVNGESFGFDTLRLKENNLRIKFDDTSGAASFPSGDWQLTANDSANGGLNKFSIDDVSGSRTPFTVEANARNHSLYVDDGGRIGNRTNAPATEFHTVDGDTAAIRLEQDGSSGFAPQTWDVAGNETNFFIRDVSNGSTLPLRIRPSAPSNAVFIDTDGDVGMGTASPTSSLDVTGTDGTTKLSVRETSTTAGARTVVSLVNNGRPELVLANSANAREWAVGGGSNLIFKVGDQGSLTGDKTKHFDLNGTTGNLVITGSITTGGGTCGGGCDAVFTEDYDLMTQADYADRMWEQGFLPNVGETIENAPINVSDKLGRMLNALEHAHIYIDHQADAIATQNARIAELETLVKSLVAK